MSTQTTNDPIETLLSVDKGDRVRLEARYYEWSPFEVARIDEVSFESPTGGVWNARTVGLNPTDARGTEREIDVYPAMSPPSMGQSYGPLEAVEVLEGGDDDRDDEGETVDHPDWLSRDARDIVYDAPVTRTLAEVLDAVERYDSILDVHKRLGAGTLGRTKNLLWDLGLRGTDERLLDDDVLEERIAEMRRCYCDE